MKPYTTITCGGANDRRRCPNPQTTQRVARSIHRDHNDHGGIQVTQTTTDFDASAVSGAYVTVSSMVRMLLSVIYANTQDFPMRSRGCWYERNNQRGPFVSRS